MRPRISDFDVVIANVWLQALHRRGHGGQEVKTLVASVILQGV